MKKLLLFLLLACFSAHFESAQDCRAQTPAQQPTAQQPLETLTGFVVDARTGEPLAKVKVISGDQSTTTDEAGAFILPNVPVGKLDLYITTVSYGLVKKTIDFRPADKDILIALSPDAAALTEQVTITTGPFETTDASAASEQTLNKRELQSLSSVLLGDPVRAAHALPGVAANDDFRSEFSVRGAAFNRVGLYVDGVLTDNFVHTVQGGFPDTGSLSVINADTVNSVSLFSGGFPSKYGYRSAAILDVETRDGNRLKPTGRIAASLSGLSGVVDGPFAGGRGSYLFAARKSYVGYLVRRINDRNQFTNPPVIEFADVQGKAIYDLTSRNQLGVSIIYGDFDFDHNRDRDFLGINAVSRAVARNLLVNGRWSYTPNPKFIWQTRVFGLRTSFRNKNRDETILQDGERTQFGLRSDISFQAHRAHRIEAGLYVRSLRVNSFAQVFDFFQGTLRDFGSFNRRGTEQAYYLQDSWTSEALKLSITAGLRVEHSSVTGETLFSSRASFAWSPTDKWRIRAGAGRYHQFPDFEQMFGRLGNPALRAEFATHYNASIERFFGDRMRFLVELYDREDSNLFFTLSEPRLVGGVISFAEFPFGNSLHGYARGIELTLQRRSANKLAGWISYAYARTRLRESQTGLTFASDTDQRHTLNVYGSYRFTESWNLSSAWRYGSGQPIPGFFREVGSGYFLAVERNRARQPAYSRVDVRVSKAFLFPRWKLTLSGEVINALNRNNVRYAGFDGFGFDGQVFGQLDRMLPILPSAGVVIEF